MSQLKFQEPKSGREAVMVAWGVKRLADLPRNKQISEDTLKKILTPSSNKAVVLCGDPEQLIDTLVTIANDSTVYEGIQGRYDKVEHLSHKDIMSQIWRTCKLKAKKWNCQVAYNDAPIGQKISESFLGWARMNVDSLRNKNKSTVLNIIAEQYFKVTKSYFGESKSQTESVVKNLFDTNLIQIDGITKDLNYTFSSSFAILSFQYITEKMEERMEEILKPGSQIDTTAIFKHVIDETNEMLRDLQRDIREVAEWDELEEGQRTATAVRGLGKRKRPSSHSREIGRKRSRWDSRSRDNIEARPKEKLARSSVTFDKLCSSLDDLTLDDVKLIPTNITHESVIALLKLAKMEKSRPKKEKALLNILASQCKCVPFVPFNMDEFPDVEVKPKITTFIISFNTSNFLAVNLQSHKLHPPTVRSQRDPAVHYRGLDPEDEKLDTICRPIYMPVFVEECLNYAEQKSQEHSTFILPVDDRQKIQMLSDAQNVFSTYKDSKSLNVDPMHLRDKIKTAMIDIFVKTDVFPTEECIQILQSRNVISMATDGSLTIPDADHQRYIEVIEKRCGTLKRVSYCERSFCMTQKKNNHKRRTK